MKRVIIILILLPVTFLTSYSQCYQDNHTFRDGEIIKYRIDYNWGILWLRAGDVYFRVDSSEISGEPAYHFTSVGKSYKAYDWFFKVRDRYEAWAAAQDLRPIKFHRDTYEGGYTKNNRYFFNEEEYQIFSEVESSERPFTRDTLSMPPCIYDVLTATYAARNIDFSNLKPQDTIPIRLILDNEIFDLYIRYHGKEVVENYDDTKFRCIKFTALLVEGSIFKGGEDLTVWVTDDNNKIPVKVSAEILVGSVKAFLLEAENLRYPMDALVE